MRHALLPMIAILTSGVLSPAYAQGLPAPYGYGYSYEPAPRGQGRNAGSAPAGRVCRQLCAADVTPCDPSEYKIADGRCQDPMWRY